jgi:hypothetical protein
MSHMIAELLDAAQGFPSSSVAGLLRSAPDLEPLVGYIESLYYIPESGQFNELLRHSELMEQKKRSRYYLMKGQMLNVINVLLKSRN